MKAAVYYNRYVDDVIIIFSSTAITEEEIMNVMNTIPSNFQYFLTHEDNNSIK
jgi:hypothetical protein